MKRSKICLIASLLAISTLTACATSNPYEGAGYSVLTPSADTTSYIVQNDRPFAEQVAGHNRQCRKDEACQK